MKQQELRNGNLIYCLLNEKIETIECAASEYPILKNDCFGSKVVEYKHLKPIPLTEQILVDACGGKIDNDSCVHFGDVILYFDCAGFSMLIKNKVIDLYVSIPKINILYLHEFQNLYFDITGEDLDINIEKIKI